MNIEILYEDNDLLAINKPAGVVVNEAASVGDKETIQSWFWQRLLQNGDKFEVESSLVPSDFDESYGDPLTIFNERKGMVHRLDKETSGALLLAKNPGSLVNLLSQFKNRQTQKKYLCLVHGLFNLKEDLIAFPIARSTDDRTKYRVDISGREAVTKYQVTKSFSNLNISELKKREISDEAVKLLKKNSNSYQGFSLVECWPKTGRTHQIRVHLNHIKHPLVGDKLYVGKKRKKLDEIWCHRHFLHASQLVLSHPRSQNELQIDAPLPQDLVNVLSLLQEKI